MPVQIMGAIRSSRLILLKGMLFLIAGLIATGILFAESVSWRPIVLHLISVWCFCRFYYFAFYVIEHYVDQEYKFSGLLDFLRYLMLRQRSPELWSREIDHAQQVCEIKNQSVPNA